MNEIQNITLQNDLIYDNSVILSYKIQYPEIIYSRYTQGKNIFNSFNKNKSIELKEYIESELFEEAKKTYEYNKSNNYPIMKYEVDMNYSITLDMNNIISLYYEQYTFTGGAHGNTVRTSQNWNLSMPKLMTLADVYPDNDYYVINILKNINSQISNQIAAENNVYFDNYCQLILDTINLDNFYLIPNSTVIYFQQYDIAPYSTGIPTFMIPNVTT